MRGIAASGFGTSCWKKDSQPDFRSSQVSSSSTTPAARAISPRFSRRSARSWHRWAWSLRAHNYTGDAAGCCGFGGLTQFANPAVADAAARLWADDPHARYLTYCMNCRDRFTKQGAQAVHLLELIYGGGKPHQVPGYSLRRDNREKLKRTMREELWNEKLSPSPSCVSLHYDGEVGGLLESRMILESDIRTVIEAAEGSGRKILHRASMLLSSPAAASAT